MTPRQIDAEEYLNLKFKKGDKRRGQAMVLLAEAKLEEQERILKIIDDLIEGMKDCKHLWKKCCYDEVLYKLKELKAQIKEKT